MSYCTVNGIKIHYEVSGEGFPFILIHANPFDRRLWLYQASRFSTFFKVINVDLRGYGYSEKRKRPTSISEMSEDIFGICRQENLDEALVMGLSVGGVLALQLGLDHPETFKALIAAGCGSGPGGRYPERIDGYRKSLKDYHLRHLRSLVSPAFAESALGRYLLGQFTDWDDRLETDAIVEIFNALQNRDVTARLHELKMPVLVINGELDNSLPRSREMAHQITGAEHRIVPGAGHACCLEDPATFDSIVFEFLEKVGLWSKK